PPKMAMRSSITPRSHAPRGNAGRDALRPVSGETQQTRRGAWERGLSGGRGEQSQADRQRIAKQLALLLRPSFQDLLDLAHPVVGNVQPLQNGQDALAMTVVDVQGALPRPPGQL